MDDLFARADLPTEEHIADGMVLLRGAALDPAILEGVGAVVAAAPFRHLVTPGGQTMSVAMTNCGTVGWLSDRRGYRYDPIDPVTGRPWPDMPPSFRLLAQSCAARAGFPGYEPDACLINRYVPGSRLTAHQDRNERATEEPIVSVSLGLPAIFQVYGTVRGGSAIKVPLVHGDVVVFGGPARMRFHGVAPIKPGHHPLTGEARINITFRKAL